MRGYNQGAAAEASRAACKYEGYDSKLKSLCIDYLYKASNFLKSDKDSAKLTSTSNCTTGCDNLKHMKG